MVAKHRFFYFTSARIIYLIGIIIFPFLMTHVLKTGEYSRFVFFSTLIATTLELANLGIPTGMKRCLLEKSDKEKEIKTEILQLIIKFLSVLFGLMGVVFLLWFKFFPKTYNGSFLFMLLCWCAAFFGVGTLFISNYLYGVERFGYYAFQEVCFSLIRLIIIPACALFAGLEGALFGILLVQSVILIINIRGIGSEQIKSAFSNFWNVSIDEFRRFIGYSGKFFICNFCEQSYRFSAIFILTIFTSKSNSEIGFLHLSFFAVSAIGMIFSAWLNAYFPTLSYLNDRSKKDDLEHLVFLLKKYLIIISGFIAFFVWTFADDFIKFLPKDYAPLSSCIKLFVSVSFFRAITTVLVFQSLATFKMNEYLKANLLWMVLYLIVFAIGGSVGKCWGILIGAMLSEVIYTIAFSYLIEKEINLKFPVSILFFIAALFVFYKSLSIFLPYSKILSFAIIACVLIIALFSLGVIKKSEILFLSKNASARKEEIADNVINEI